MDHAKPIVSVYALFLQKRLVHNTAKAIRVTVNCMNTTSMNLKVFDEIKFAVPFDTIHCSQVKFVNCLNNKLEDITFRISGAIERHIDFCLTPATIPLGRRMNAPKVDRYMFKLHLSSETVQSASVVIKGKSKKSLLYSF